MLLHSTSMFVQPRHAQIALSPFRTSQYKQRGSRATAICAVRREKDNGGEAHAHKQPTLNDVAGQVKTGVLAALTAALFTVPGQVQAADFVKTGVCLVENCPLELAECVADPTCAENIICLNNCNGREDEAECQIRCGDLYASPAVQNFTKCAVTKKKCVGKRIDEEVYPVPPDSVLIDNFDINKFQGEWSITAGLNALFDDFDCQVHNFSIEKPGTLHADIKWRIKEADGDFIERSTVQTFDQDKDVPGHLHNGDNEFLNYTDDWYVLDFVPDEYAVIYYRGNNDAWAGYGGLTVYTRDREFPEKYRSEIEGALGKVGLSINNLKETDNSCKPHPRETFFQIVKGTFQDLFPPKADTKPPPLDKIRKQPPKPDDSADATLTKKV